MISKSNKRDVKSTATAVNDKISITKSIDLTGLPWDQICDKATEITEPITIRNGLVADRYRSNREPRQMK